MTSSGAALIPPEIQAILGSSRKDETYWLVGGAVRDYLLQRRVVDFDFVVKGDALGLARRVANLAGGDFYTLDDDRRAGRVLMSQTDTHYCLDFAQITGKTLEEDLHARDFTINAMALDLDHPDTLIDPSGGLQDLRDGLLRLPATDAISADPIRALRALRLAVDLNFKIEPGAYDQVKQAGDWLDQISPERLRDELFRLLGLNRPALGLRLLDHAGLLDAVLPSVASLRSLQQPPPHQIDMLDHTLAVVQRLSELLATLAPRHDAESSGDMALAEVALRLGRFRPHLSRYMLQEVSSDRTVRQLLYLAALFHDSGKPSAAFQTPPESEKTEDDHGAGVRFIGYEAASAELVVQAAEALKLSKAESEWLHRVVLNHMRPFQLAGAGPTKRAIYRYHRQLEPTGVAVALLSLADRLGTSASPPDEDEWKAQVDVVRVLLEPYFEEFDTAIKPEPLIDGDEVMAELELEPGPQIGEILGAVLEAQAIGEVATQEEALAYARRLYRESLK